MRVLNVLQQYIKKDDVLSVFVTQVTIWGTLVAQIHAHVYKYTHIGLITFYPRRENSRLHIPEAFENIIYCKVL